MEKAKSKAGEGNISYLAGTLKSGRRQSWMEKAEAANTEEEICMAHQTSRRERGRYWAGKRNLEI